MGANVSTPEVFEVGDLRSRNAKDSADPVLEKLRNLHVVPPILKQQTADAAFSEILLRRSLSQASETLDPTTTAELLTLYQEWQRATAAKVGKKQEELGHKIIGLEELSMKLLQRLSYAGRVMETSATHLQDVHQVQHEIVEMKQKLKDSLESYETLRKKMDALGLYERNITPQAIASRDHESEELDRQAPSSSGAAPR